MQTIKVLGTGCPKCQQTTSNVEKAVHQLGIEATIVKVDDIMDIMQYEIMSTPAVVVDEEVMVKGRVPSVEELVEMINTGEKDEGNISGGCCGS